MKNTSLYNDIVQWDINSWSVALDIWDKDIDWSNKKTALEIGARNGGLSLWLALKNIDVICSDIENPQALALPLHQKYNVQHLISYQSIDATQIPFENYFDIIVFKSVLGGIGRNNNFQLQQKAIQEMHKALKKDGVLLFAENLVASPFHQKLRKKFVKWGNEWRYLNLNELKILLNIFSSYQIKTTGFLAAFGPKESQRKFLSYLDKLIFNHIVPDNYKYIAYGFAIK
ncbi:MAG: class I SAM-dependent methyltransferase [Bacteroidota bacterium]